MQLFFTSASRLCSQSPEREGEGSGGTSGGRHHSGPGWVAPHQLEGTFAAASQVNKGTNRFTLRLELPLNNTITGGNLIPEGGRLLSSLHPPALNGPARQRSVLLSLKKKTERARSCDLQTPTAGIALGWRLGPVHAVARVPAPGRVLLPRGASSFKTPESGNS